ncbi:hypothetical protein GE061_016120 [Apolygus lucorum]|uniref:Carbonic anhydrase n=1 Tax=Apolygus lucorum TaxID=248454 RepID=A0A8S9XFC6_APOLU|nr:hypothetical protein GE061_016120 [Apolygus lucorum]
MPIFGIIFQGISLLYSECREIAMVTNAWKTFLVLAFLSPIFSSGHSKEEVNSRLDVNNKRCSKREPHDSSVSCHPDIWHSISPRFYLHEAARGPQKHKSTGKKPKGKKFKKKKSKGKKHRGKKSKGKKSRGKKGKKKRKSRGKRQSYHPRKKFIYRKGHPHADLYKRDANGQVDWPINLCDIGKMQSPINIDTTKLVRVVKPPLELKGFDDLPTMTKVYNNHGQYVKVGLQYKTLPTVKGGILDEGKTYRFLQYHFHWGNSGNEGSEHAIDGKMFPFEAHFVFGDSSRKAQDLTNDLHNSGIVVLTIIYEVSYDNQTSLDFLTKILASNEIRNPDSYVVGPDYKLRDMMPVNFNEYYTYLGSLTTPKCGEGTRFIIFTSRAKVALRQTELFRNILRTTNDPTSRYVYNRQWKRFWKFVINRKHERSGEICPKPSVSCTATTVPQFNSGFVNSFQKSWYSSLFTRCQEPRSLLSLPPPVCAVQVAGFKVKYQLRRRCKDCYFVVRQERKYVMCPTHPRHKQMAPVKRPRYTWILTHASYSKVRPW